MKRIRNFSSYWLCGLGALLAAGAAPWGSGAWPATPVLSASFDTDLNGAAGAPNPYSASNLVKIVEIPGAKGRAARFAGTSVERGRPAPTPIEQPALIFSGENLPSRAGWLEFRLRTDERAEGTRQSRRWIAALPPVVGELYFESKEVGLGLGLIQEARGDLVLALHRFEEGRLTADYRSKGKTVGMNAPDAVAIRFSAEVADASRSWRTIRLGWDQAAGKVFLGVDDDLRSADVDFPETRFRALILGSPPRILNVQDDIGFSGYLDELVVSGQIELPTQLVEKEKPPPDLLAVDLDAEWAKAVEAGVRRHLDLILETQRAGGWAPIVALPSGLHFLSAPSLLPYGDRFFSGMGRGSSIVVALILLKGYEVLDDRHYLAAARSIGDRLLDLQNDIGSWPGQALLSTTGASIRQHPQYAIIKDRIQTMPILLLWRLYDATGDERYAAAASRAVGFMKKAQNPSGSWPNRVVVATWRRESMSGLEGAGENNDYATSDAMNIMLVMYRRSSDVEYLARYLRGADWLVRVFQDGPAKGWAKQYDANDCPIVARHHEPAGVAFREMDDVPRTLLEAYQLTGSPRYREVLQRWAVYVRSIKDEEGWYPYYDIETGKAIKRVGGRSVPADARERRDYGVTRVLARVDQVLSSTAAHEQSRPNSVKESSRLRRRALQALGAMDSRYGTWLSTAGPQGPAMSPHSPLALIMLHALADAKGGVSAAASQESSRDEDWRNEFGHVMSSVTRLAPIDAKVLSAARLVNRKFKTETETVRSTCRRKD